MQPGTYPSYKSCRSRVEAREPGGMYGSQVEDARLASDKTCTTDGNYAKVFTAPYRFKGVVTKPYNTQACLLESATVMLSDANDLLMAHTCKQCPSPVAPAMPLYYSRTVRIYNNILLPLRQVRLIATDIYTAQNT